MGNSLKKNTELAVYSINVANFLYGSKINLIISNQHVLNALNYFDSIKPVDTNTINNDQKFTKLIDEAYEILELKQEIHKYLKQNNLKINDVTFQKIYDDFNLGKNKEYSLYRAYLYKKHMPSIKSVNCDNNDIDFKKLLTSKLFILEKDNYKYSKKELCQMIGKNTLQEVLQILKYDVDKEQEPKDGDEENQSKIKKSKRVVIEDEQEDISLKKSKDKLCGPKNSKKNPAYTREELIDILKENADKLKLKKNLISKMTKNQMCKFLPKLNINVDLSSLNLDVQDKELDKKLEDLLIEVENKKKKNVSYISEEELALLVSSGKKCGPINTKKIPAYTKDEIIEIIMPHLDKYKLSKSKVLKMTKTELCKYVEEIKGIKPVIIDDDGNLFEQPKNLPKEGNQQEEDDDEDNDEEDNDFFIKDIVKKIKKDIKNKKEPIKDDKGDKKDIKNNEEREDKSESKSEDEEYVCYNPLNKDVKLQNYQIRVAKHMLKHRGLLAIHGTGTGKTLTAVASINCILKNYPKMDIIVITPTSLISNFKKELEKFGLDIEKSSIKNRIKFYSFKQFVIDIHTTQRNFQKCKDNFIIIDEAHNLRNLGKREKVAQGETPKGLTSATILQCIKSASKVLLLTATPILNRISDIDSLIAMIDGTDIKPLPKNYTLDDIERKFKCKISINPGNKTASEFPVRIDIPHEETIFIMDDEYYQRYYDIQSEKGAEFQNRFRSNRFLNAVRRAALSLDDEKSPKVQWTFNKIKEEYEQGRKCVVYTAWRESGVNHVRRLLDLAKIPYGVYTGDMTKTQRDATRDAYNKNKIKILIITRAGGEGLDLKGTNNVILMEPNWNKETDEQIIGRGIRYKSHSHLPEKLRYTNVYKLYMFKPKEVYEDDPLPSADEILFDLSYEKKDPMIKNFMNMLEPFSIENVDCDKCCIVKKLKDNSSFNDDNFFDYYKINKKTKLDIDEQENEEENEEEKQKKKTYKAPENKTYMFGYKPKNKSSSKPKSKSKLSKLKEKVN